MLQVVLWFYWFCVVLWLCEMGAGAVRCVCSASSCCSLSTGCRWQWWVHAAIGFVVLCVGRRGSGVCLQRPKLLQLVDRLELAMVGVIAAELVGAGGRSAHAVDVHARRLIPSCL
jgi:hypothetical protein